jgi:tetratricopeptide (TPR) repeat protein
MNPAVLQRFIKIAITVIIVGGLAILAYDWFASQEPGDYYVRQGDIRLSDGEYDKAIASFDKALQEMPDHRGALMGRALVFIQTERYDEAIAELQYLIDFLNRTLQPDDLTGRGTLAAAHANLGIVYDRLGRYEDALEEYAMALNTDEESVSGPGLVDKILYDADPSTVRDRAIYIYEQLQLPEDERLLSVPELDAEERMYKP